MSSSTGNSHGSNAGGGGGGCGGEGGSNSGTNFGTSFGFGTFSGGGSHGGSLVSVGGNSSYHGEIASHESRIDKMRRFISSPLTRRKSTSQASTESAPPMVSSSKHSTDSHQPHKIFGTPIEKLTHQRSFNEMSSSSICSSSSTASNSSSQHHSNHLSASSYCNMRSMSTSGLPGSLFSSFTGSSTSSSSPSTTAPSATTTTTTGNLGTPMATGQTSILITSSSTSSRKVVYDKEQTVPFVITRLCHYIEDSQGLMQEGLFRTSGNARLIEKLKASFDCNGDAPLETEGDIPSAAALLKLFLRELPVPLIPQSIHCLFLDTVQETINQGESYDKDAFIGRLKMLVENLPDENYFLLKYLSRFLHQVARHESYNRMNPSSLGIIFGPNIFRVAAEDYRGLREQSLTNQVVTFFITDYGAIFGKDSPDKNEEINLLTSLDQDQEQGKTINCQGKSGISEGPSARESVKEVEKKVIIVSIEPDDSQKTTRSGQRRREEEEPQQPTTRICSSSSTAKTTGSSSGRKQTSTNMTKEDDLDASTEATISTIKIADLGVSSGAATGHYTPLQIDIPPIDCELSDSSSLSPTTLACSSISPCPIDSKEYLLSIDSSNTSNATSPIQMTVAPITTTTATKSSQQSSFGEGGKRKDRKSILSSSSPVVRSSSEERKPIGFSGQMVNNNSSSSNNNPVNQDVRRCNSYQDVCKDNGETSFIPAHTQQAIKSSNLSSDSVTQSPKPKRRETESIKAKLSRSTLSFELRPSSLDLTGKSVNQSVESKSEPTIRGKASLSHGHSEALATLNKPTTVENSAEKDSSSQLTSSQLHTLTYSKDSYPTNHENNNHANIERHSISSCHQDQPQSSSTTALASQHKTKTNSHSSSTSSSSSLPHIDLNALHKNAATESAMVSDLRYCWSSANESFSTESLLGEPSEEIDDGDDDTQSETQSDPRLLEATKSNEPVQNAAVQILRRRNTYEAPLSPSAYRGFLGQRAPHLDHTIPPSPPGEQEYHMHGNKAAYNQESTVVKEAKRKIHNLKRRLKQFERDFEKETGYRPSHEQKMKSDVAQPILFELNKFRKILREYKEDARMTIEFYEGVFNEMQRSLKERRYVVGRPETIEEMSIDQICEEKLDLQKSLLKYESVFGRPCRREDRAVMKPLYDRYRTIRNLVSKIPKNKEPTDLQPILEHVAMNFTSPSHSPKNSLDVASDDDDDGGDYKGDENINKSNQKKGKRLVESVREQDEEEKEDDDDDQENINSNNNANRISNNNVNSDDNNNQVVVDNNNPSKLEFTSNTSNINTRTQPRPEATQVIKLKESSLSRYTKGGCGLGGMGSGGNSTHGETIVVPLSLQTSHKLHELPPGELVKELAVVRREKTELRKMIRAFEDEFYRTHGRKVNEIEKSQMESVYTNYKSCKKKLRLLEVFIEKYEKRKMEP